MHAHGHDHDHAHDQGDSVRRLWIALSVTGVFLVAEVVGGILSNSLALLADAGHMLTDVAALGLSLFVAWFSRRPETDRRTYGYLRLEILAAFVNGATLLLLSAWILIEAVLRFGSPEPISGGLMLLVAVIGLLVNVVAAWTLHPSQGGSLNIRGAYLHVLSDLLGSVGTVAAALLVSYGGWLVADPIASVFVTLLILRSAWRLVRESVDVLLESTPAHISLGAVRAQLEAIPGVESVHDLHVWTVTSNHIAMSAHAIVRSPERQQHVLEHALDAMRLFGIHHVTIQLERQEMYEREMHLHA
jgi:cobalt-zinc-cadmium efflux system protein